MKIVLICSTLMLLYPSLCMADFFQLPRPDKDKEGEEEKHRTQILYFPQEERTIKKKINLPYATKHKDNRCEADISLSYSQADVIAKVKTRINLLDGAAQCPDARGQYRIQVRSMGDNGELRTQEFNES